MDEFMVSLQTTLVAGLAGINTAFALAADRRGFRAFFAGIAVAEGLLFLGWLAGDVLEYLN